MKTYEMPVTLTIKFEAEDEKEAMSLLTFMKLDPTFEEQDDAKLLNVEEDWGELKVIK
jgi:hypothetical protein